MNLLIISCTPRVVKNSNTDKILSKFKDGYESLGNTTETYYLSKRNDWDLIKERFYKSENILFALPLYVECIPGIMMEFLEELEPKKDNKTKIGFLLQGGFPESSQLRCCEQYLETLPKQLGCIYNGTLLKGGMFEVSIVDGKMREKMITPFYEMGKYYAKNNYFDKEKVNEFASPEYFPKKMMVMFKLTNPIRKIVLNKIAKKLGCTKALNYKPYNF